MPSPPKIFIAYSLRDRELLHELHKHLTPLERSRRVTIYYDGKIDPGVVWEQATKDQLHQADIILLLVSASAIASEYFYDKVAKEALERHEERTTLAIPLILRPCAWQDTPLAKLQALPKDGKPITSWANRDDAYSDVVRQIWKIIRDREDRQEERQQTEAANEAKTGAEAANKAKAEAEIRKAQLAALKEERQKKEADNKRKTKAKLQKVESEKEGWLAMLRKKILRKKEKQKENINHTAADKNVNSGRPKPSIDLPSSVLPDVENTPDKNEDVLPDELRSAKSTSTEAVVDCSVYAAPEAVADDDVLIQVWLHLPEKSDAVEDSATTFDEDAVQRAFQSLSLPIETDDELTLVLTAKGIELDETTQTIRWNGSMQSAQFFAYIPKDFEKSKVIFTLRVFKEDIPIGHLKFIIKVSKEVITLPPKQALGAEARQYKKAFISYASKDRNEVLKRVQMLDKLGISFFQDLINLNPGERWEQKLYENIDDADLFLLFWSTAAKESKWVLKELQYAISLKQNEDDQPPVIQPVPIEGPPIVYPPEELGHMHFNDRILYFIVKEKGNA